MISAGGGGLRSEKDSLLITVSNTYSRIMALNVHLYEMIR